MCRVYGRVMTNASPKIQKLQVSPAAAFRRKVLEARNQGREIIDLTTGDPIIQIKVNAGNASSLFIRLQATSF